MNAEPERAFAPPADPEKYQACCRCQYATLADRLVDSHCPDCLPFRKTTVQQTALELPATMFDELAARRNRRRTVDARSRRSR